MRCCDQIKGRNMNKQIKRLAEQWWDRRLDGVHFDQEKFAALVAAYEREECAKFCEEQYEFYGFDHVFAAGIRARGEQ